MSFSCCRYSARRRNDASSVPVSSPTRTMLTYSGGKIVGWRAKLAARSRPPSRLASTSSSVSRSTALCVEAARPRDPAQQRHAGLGDRVHLAREQHQVRVRRLAEAELAQRLRRRRWSSRRFAGAISIGVMPLPNRRAATPSGVSPSIRPVTSSPPRDASGVAEDRHQLARSAVQQRPAAASRSSFCEHGFDLRHDRLAVVEAAGDAHGLGDARGAARRPGRARRRPAS